MDFQKHFCRLVTQEELSNDDVIEYYDVVTELVPAKVVVAHTDGNKATVEVIQYESSEEGYNIYEIVLSESIEEEEGAEIAQELMHTFEFDFDFETSTEA